MDGYTSINSREYLLVKLFRAYQMYYCLLLDERQALANSDFQRLYSLAERKKVYNETISRLAQQMDIGWSAAQALKTPYPVPGSQSDDRPEQIQRGIKVLSGVIQELAGGNLSMASSALRRIESTKELLISQDGWPYTSDLASRPPGLVSVLLYLRSHEEILRTVLDGNHRLAALIKVD